jgi:hypothetical protein
MREFLDIVNTAFLYVNPQLEIKRLNEKIDMLQFILLGLGFVILLLVVIIALQRRSLYESRGEGSGRRSVKSIFKTKKKAGKAAALATGVIASRQLPDPGLIFKYSLAQEQVMEKEITVGQVSGNIKTYSTEIIDDHLTVYIRIIEGQRDRDIYDLPDQVVEEYQVDLRRDGKVLIFYPGLEGYREMGSRERIYIKGEPDVTGDPTFASLEAKTPVRFRLGDRLNQDGKFINGYFEFHLFTQNYEVKTKAGIPKIEKNFLLRLYKIYPGYDTGSTNSDGLYPMVDPFTTG